MLGLDPMGVSSLVPRVPWYFFFGLECKHMANTASCVWWGYPSPQPDYVGLETCLLRVIIRHMLLLF